MVFIHQPPEELLAEQNRWLKTPGAQENLRVFGANGSVTLSVKVEPRDLWIGVFWTRTQAIDGQHARTLLDIYVCLVPCLPIIVRIVGRWRVNPNWPKAMRT